ncbi:MAG: hypothetical protein WDA21_03070 [Bacilli bacterium]
MNEFLIKEYVNRLNIDDIKCFSNKKGIEVDEKETKIIHDYIKRYWRTIVYGNPKEILNELKEKVSDNTYNKIEKLYIEFKEKINL